MATVRELLGAVTAQGATGGVVATSGSFTREALAFAQSNGIQVIDGDAIAALLPNSPAELIVENNKPGALACPKCGSEMVTRTAKKGSNAGKQFRGCSQFPRCRATVDL